MPDYSRHTTALRRRAVAWVMAFTANTSIAPGRYKRHLLGHYEHGELTIDQVLDLLDAPTYQLVYRSRATTPPSPADLQHLLDQARERNAVAHLTGVLLYRDGGYVQVLEGAQDQVQAVFARILRDPRHTQVVTISEGEIPACRFLTWSMALGNVDVPAVIHLLDAVLAAESLHDDALVNPLLYPLLDACGVGSETGRHEAA